MSKIIYNDRAYGEIIGGATDTFVGTDGTNPGTSGLVPAPGTSEAGMFLKSDGTWDIPAGGGSSGGSIATTVSYMTTAPTAANTTGLRFVLLDEEPETKYDGWIYLIKETQ